MTDAHPAVPSQLSSLISLVLSFSSFITVEFVAKLQNTRIGSSPNIGPSGSSSYSPDSLSPQRARSSQLLANFNNCLKYPSSGTRIIGVGTTSELTSETGKAVGVDASVAGPMQVILLLIRTLQKFFLTNRALNLPFFDKVAQNVAQWYFQDLP